MTTYLQLLNKYTPAAQTQQKKRASVSTEDQQGYTDLFNLVYENLRPEQQAGLESMLEGGMRPETTAQMVEILRHELIPDEYRVKHNIHMSPGAMTLMRRLANTQLGEQSLMEHLRSALTPYRTQLDAFYKEHPWTTWAYDTANRFGGMGNTWIRSAAPELAPFLPLLKPGTVAPADAERAWREGVVPHLPEPFRAVAQPGKYQVPAAPEVSPVPTAPTTKPTPKPPASRTVDPGMFGYVAPALAAGAPIALLGGLVGGRRLGMGLLGAAGLAGLGYGIYRQQTGNGIDWVDTGVNELRDRFGYAPFAPASNVSDSPAR